MPEHYPTNAWCNVCRRKTMHRVDHKRLGSCTEHSAEGMSKSQQKRREKETAEMEQPGLDLSHKAEIAP